MQIKYSSHDGLQEFKILAKFIKKLHMKLQHDVSNIRGSKQEKKKQFMWHEL